MDTKTFISVIIPSYNACNSIIDTINSIKSQTIPPNEIIIVDDGSTDKTFEILSDYISHNDATKSVPVYLFRQNNSGPAAARNHGARMAKGSWLAFLDADDTWQPEKLERQLAYIDDIDVVLIHCRKSPLNEPLTFESLWKKNQIANSTVMVRRDVFDRVGGFDEDRSLIGVEDYNLWLQLIWQGKFATHPEFLINYTPAPGNLTSQVERFAAAELVNVKKIAIKFNLSADLVDLKIRAIYEEYGRALFYQGNMKAARKMLSQCLSSPLSYSNIFRWFATFLPFSMIKWYRNLSQQLSSDDNINDS